MLKLSIYAFLVFPLVSLFTKAASVDICRILGDGIYAHRNYKTGETLCCKTISCTAGYEAVMCDKDNAFSTSCRECPRGTYQPDETSSADMQSCYVKKTCNGSMRALHRDSPEMDTVCVCDIKQGFCSRSGAIRNPRFCQKHICPTGLLLKPNCSCVPESEMTKKIPTATTGKPPLEPKMTASNGTNGTACRDGSCQTGITAQKPVSSGSNVITELPLNFENSTQRTIIIVVVVCSVVIVGVLIVAVVCKRCPKNKYSSVESIHLDSTAPLSDGTERGLLVENPALSNGTNSNVLHNPVTVRQSTDSPPNDPPCNDVLREAGDTGVNEPGNNSEDNDGVCITSKTFPQNAADTTGYLMTTTDKNKLTNNLSVLVSNLSLCEIFWSLLISNETITLNMKSQIMETGKQRSERVSMLIEYLSRRSCHAFRTFLVALIFTKQDHLAQTLDQNLTKEIKQMCPTDEHLRKYIQGLRLKTK